MNNRLFEERLQLAEHLRFDLPNAFAGDRAFLADILEGVFAAFADAETHPEDALSQRLRGAAQRYADVMSIKRITISVPSVVASRIKKAAGDTPVSAWVTDVVEGHLDDAELERQWQSFYRAVSPTRADTRRAEAIHKRLTKRSGRRGAA